MVSSADTYSQFNPEDLSGSSSESTDVPPIDVPKSVVSDPQTERGTAPSSSHSPSGLADSVNRQPRHPSRINGERIGTPPTIKPKEKSRTIESQRTLPRDLPFIDMLRLQQEKGGSTAPDEPDSTLFEKAVNRSQIREAKTKELQQKLMSADYNQQQRIQKTLNLLHRTKAQAVDHQFVKQWLYENYEGHCQICHPTEFPTTFTQKNGDNHFVRHYLVKFEDTVKYIDEGNALCLCSTHHSMFEYAQWDLLSTLRTDLEHPEIELDDDSIMFLKIRISFNGEPHFIRYREEHFEMMKLLVEKF